MARIIRTFSLRPEAVEILENVDNKSKFVEDLIIQSGSLPNNTIKKEKALKLMKSKEAELSKITLEMNKVKEVLDKYKIQEEEDIKRELEIKEEKEKIKKQEVLKDHFQGRCFYCPRTDNLIEEKYYWACGFHAGHRFNNHFGVDDTSELTLENFNKHTTTKVRFTTYETLKNKQQRGETLTETEKWALEAYASRDSNDNQQDKV